MWRSLCVMVMLLLLGACQHTPASGSFEHLLAEAQAGSAIDQNRLGLIYHYGQGVPQDYAAAYEWYHKAALQGVNEAQYNLGYLYHHGYGVAQDYSKAYVWYTLASVAKNPQASVMAKEMAEKLSPRELQQAMLDAAVLKKKLAPAKSP